MVTEATLVTQTSIPWNFTVADGTGIEKGTLLKLTDPMTAIISTANGDKIAGIAAAEKIASDGVTKLAVHRTGVFKMRCSGAVSVGQGLQAFTTNNSNNCVGLAALNISGSSAIGHALETGANGETIRVALNIGAGGSA